MEILIISNLFQIVAQLHSDQVLKFQHVSVLCLEEPLRRDEKFQILIKKQKLPSTLQRLQMPSGVSLSLQVTMILRFSSKRLKGRFEGTCSCVTFWVRSGDAAEIFLRSSSISGPHPTATLAPKLPDSGGKCISFQSFYPKQYFSRLYPWHVATLCCVAASVGKHTSKVGQQLQCLMTGDASKENALTLTPENCHVVILHS